MSGIVIQELGAEALDSEQEVVRRWRREQFVSLGFDTDDARLLADSAADLGQARRLRRTGCPLELAFRILV
jgi:hypothetical protein